MTASSSGTSISRGAAHASGKAPRIRNSRRRAELGLILFGLVIVGIAYVLAALGRSKALPTNVIPFLCGILALFVVAHIVVRRFAPNADPMILPVAVLLNGIGYVFIARLNSQLAVQQAGWTLIGIVGFAATLIVVRRVRILERNRYTIGLIGVLLVLLPLIPGIGVSINGSRIWTRIGPISFQPGEFAKIALAIFFAAYLVERREVLGMATWKVGPLRLPDPKALAPLLVAWGFSLLVMMFEKDLGSALMFFVLFLAITWVGTSQASYLAVGGVLFAGGAFLSWATFSHVQTRVSMWINPWVDVKGKGYQIVQAQYAMGWGGSTGTGLGLGISGRIPYQETDFIFAIIGEELGLLGTSAVLAAFLLLAGTGFRVAMACRDPFSKLLATGLTTQFAFQSFLIMAGVTRLLPLTGVTLPFVSYGGSSLVSNWVLVALLIRLSDEANTQSLIASATSDDEPTTITARA